MKNHQAIIESLDNKDLLSAEPLFDSLNWTTDSVQAFQQVGRDGEQIMFCYAPTTAVGLHLCR